MRAVCASCDPRFTREEFHETTEVEVVAAESELPFVIGHRRNCAKFAVTLASAVSVAPTSKKLIWTLRCTSTPTCPLPCFASVASAEGCGAVPSEVRTELADHCLRL